MKYPQLVSTRAVSAISDWLVSRLEQLGVESAQIYSRLLLSLLQSSVQLNDPIEFSNLELYLASRKGGGGSGSVPGHHHKRYHYLPSNTETLKKLNAVLCLREIVSIEHETICLEQLVDELCVKLKDIEQQQQELEQFPSTIIKTTATTRIAKRTILGNDDCDKKAVVTSSYNNRQQQQQHNNNNTGNLINAQEEEQENDPKKRYFRAFPALSKEMEESFLLWRRNTKTLTWPIIGHIVTDNTNISNSKSNISVNTDTDGNYDDKSNNSYMVDNKISLQVVNTSRSTRDGHNDIEIVSEKGADKVEIEIAKKLDKKSEWIGNFHKNNKSSKPHNSNNKKSNTKQKVTEGTAAKIIATTNATITNLKRKSRHRRHNQFLSQNKEKFTSYLRNKNSFTNGYYSRNYRNYHYNDADGYGEKKINNQLQQQKEQHSDPKCCVTSLPSTTANIWDTDFKGCWEMGPDLIEEFLLRQNRKITKKQKRQQRQQQQSTRYRTNSESCHRMNTDDDNESDELLEFSQCILTDKVMNKKLIEGIRDYYNSSAMTLPNVDISFFSDDDDDIEKNDSNDFNIDITNESYLMNLPYKNIVCEEGMTRNGGNRGGQDCSENEDNKVTVVPVKRLYERACPMKYPNNHNNNDYNYDPQEYDITENIISNIIGNEECKHLHDDIGRRIDKEQDDIAQYEAKFHNSDVQALWQNGVNTNSYNNHNKISTNVEVNEYCRGTNFVNTTEKAAKKDLQSTYFASTSLNALAPCTHELWSFWSDYDKQQQQLQNKLSSATSISSMVTTRIGDSGASSGTGTAIDSGNDFFSMPINFDKFNKSVGAMRLNNYNYSNQYLRNNNYSGVDIDSMDGSCCDGGAGFNSIDTDNNNIYESNGKPSMIGLMKSMKTPTGGVFLQNSIWSSSGDYLDSTGAVTLIADTDESFLFKVWQSNKILNQIDPDNNYEHNNNEDKIRSLYFKDDINANIGRSNAMRFSSFTANLKWSEGINAPSCGYNLSGDNDSNIIASTTTATPFSSDANVNDFGHGAFCCTDNNCKMIDCCTSRHMGKKCHSLNVIADTASTFTGANWHMQGNFYNLNTTRPDLHSWSAANPTSLSEMYGDDSGGLDVCDSIISTISDDNNGESNNATVDDNISHNITLPNHCNVTSSFIAYSRIKQYSTHLQPKPLQQQQSPPLLHLTDEIVNNLGDNSVVEGSGDGGSNTSMNGGVGGCRSPFHPIELYKDGYSFEIDSDLDVVEYERDTDGYFCLKADQYLTYNRDNILSDLNVATHSKGSRENKVTLPVANNNFSVKFHVLRHCERASQTDDQDFKIAAEIANKTTTFLVPSFSASTSTLKQQLNVPAVCDETIVEAASKAMKSGIFVGSNTGQGQTINLNKYCTWLSSDTAIDEVDFAKSSTCLKMNDIGINNNHSNVSQISKNWSMKEIEKQCQLRCQKRKSEQCCNIVDNKSSCSNLCFDNSEDGKRLGTHTLWGICAACNRCMDEQSLPANHLMRDELRLEADEIMSDLRYMQDLYIGNNDYNNDHLDELHDIIHTEVDVGYPYRSYSRNYNDKNNEKAKSPIYFSSDIYAINHMKDAITDNMNNMECVQEAVFKKVNRLIEDFLKPPVPLSRNEYNKHEPPISQEISSNSLVPSIIKGYKSKFIKNNAAACNVADAERMKPLTNDYWQEKMSINCTPTITPTSTSTNFWKYDSHPQKYEIDIWKHSTNDNRKLSSSMLEFNKSMKVLRRSKVEPNNIIGNDVDMKTPNNVEEEKYLSKLNREHENLSKIWQRRTPPLSPLKLPLFSTVQQDHDITMETAVTRIDNNDLSTGLDTEKKNEIYNNNIDITQKDETMPLSTLSSTLTLCTDNDNNNSMNNKNATKEDNNATDNIMVERKNLKNLENPNITNNLTQSVETIPSMEKPNYRCMQKFFSTAIYSYMKFVGNRKRRHSASQNIYQQHLRINDDNNNNNNNTIITNLNNFKLTHNIRNGDHLNNGNHDKIIVKNRTRNFMLLPMKPYHQQDQQQNQQTIVTCEYWASDCSNDASLMTTNEISPTTAATAMMILTAAATTDTPATSAAVSNNNRNYQGQENISGTHKDTTNEIILYADSIDNGNDSDNINFIDGNEFSRLMIDKGNAATTTTILKQVAMLARPLTR